MWEELLDRGGIFRALHSETHHSSMNQLLKGDGPCAICGTENNPVWFTSNVFWNAVTAGQKGKILCLYCFIEKAEAIYDVRGWLLSPEWSWKQKVLSADV